MVKLNKIDFDAPLNTIYVKLKFLHLELMINAIKKKYITSLTKTCGSIYLEKKTYFKKKQYTIIIGKIQIKITHAVI